MKNLIRAITNIKFRLIVSTLLGVLVVPAVVFAVVQINGQGGDIQTFQDDGNIVINSSGNTHTLGWRGVLPVSRGGTGRGAFTAGSLLFSDGTIITEDNSNLFWDDTNNRLGIGTYQPISTLDVTGNASVSGNLEVEGNIIGNIVSTNLVPYTGAIANVDLGTYNLSATGLTSINDATINLLNVGLGGGSIWSNTAVGRDALKNNTVGYYNTAIGYGSLSANTSKTRNTAVGYATLINNSGEANTAVGSEAMMYNTTGDNNTALGMESLYFNISGLRNTALGVAALAHNNNGSDNIAIGFLPLSNNTSGGSNIAVGYYALVNNQTGNKNIAIGTNAAKTQADGVTYLTTASNSIYIGSGVQGYDNNDSNSIVIGTNAIGAGSNKTVIGNANLTDVYFGSSSGNAKLHAANICTTSSGTSAPTSIPTALGQIYIDTVAAKVYISTGTSSSADWALVN